MRIGMLTPYPVENYACLLYTSDAADDLLCVDLGGRSIIKKKKKKSKYEISKKKHIRVMLFHILFFFFKQKTAYEIMPSLVGSEMCIRDRNAHSIPCGKLR